MPKFVLNVDGVLNYRFSDVCGVLLTVSWDTYPRTAVGDRPERGGLGPFRVFSSCFLISSVRRTDRRKSWLVRLGR